MTLLVPIGLGSTGLWAGGHHAVNFSHLVGISVCETAHRIWLRAASLALGEGLKVLDVCSTAELTMLSCLTVFLFSLHFFPHFSDY